MLAFQATRQDGNSVVRFLDEKSRVRATHQYQSIQLIRERKAEKCRGVDTEKIDWFADRAQRGQVERSVGEFLTERVGVAHCQSWGRRNLHLCSVRKVSVARIDKVRSATHEALLDAEEIRAIVQIGMVHDLILRLLFRLQLRLAEGVVPCRCQRHDDADRNCYFQQPFH